MSESTNATVEMRFEDGSRINAWTSFSMRDTYTDPLGELNFVAEPDRSRIQFYKERLKKGAIVAVLINNAPQGIFIIQTVTKTIGKAGYVFGLTCHTPLVTPYQGCADPNYSFSTTDDTPLTRVILDLLSPYGFDTVIGDDGASVSAACGLGPGKKRKKKVNAEALNVNEARTQDGERAYAFCSRLVTRLGHQIRMSCAADTLGAILIESPDYDQAPSYTLVLDPLDGSGATHIEGTRFLAAPPVEIVDSNDDQYSECTIRGIAKDTPGSTTTNEPYVRVTATDVNPKRPQYSSYAANFKPLHIKDQHSRDRERATSAAKLAMGIRAPKAFSITGSVDGMLAHNGLVWTVGTMARVVIPDEQIDEPMFVYERVFTCDRKGGKLTRMKFLPSGALSLGDAPG